MQHKGREIRQTIKFFCIVPQELAHICTVFFPIPRKTPIAVLHDLLFIYSQFEKPVFVIMLVKFTAFTGGQFSLDELHNPSNLRRKISFNSKCNT